MISVLGSRFASSAAFHTVFWSALLIVACPVFGVVLASCTACRLALRALSPRRRAVDTKIRELAVVVTGCDCGFGRSYALHLAERGFVVFAGCLTEDGTRRYDDHPNVVALLLDVTTDDGPAHAAAVVSDWLRGSSSSTSTKPRYLHAVLSNAGLGSNGPIDWTTVADFERVMEVNFLGTIRVVKAFSPMLRRQATRDGYDAARVLLVGSFVGLVALPGSPAYVASKHAVEAFATCLRAEWSGAFDGRLSVVTINPTVHGTTMLDKATASLELKWRTLSPDTKEEYGEDCYRVWRKTVADDTITIAWDAAQAVERVVECVEDVSPPSHVVLGMDGRFVLIFLRMLPTWIVAPIMRVLSPMIPPLRARTGAGR